MRVNAVPARFMARRYRQEPVNGRRAAPAKRHVRWAAPSSGRLRSTRRRPVRLVAGRHEDAYRSRRTQSGRTQFEISIMDFTDATGRPRVTDDFCARPTARTPAIPCEVDRPASRLAARPSMVPMTQGGRPVVSVRTTPGFGAEGEIAPVESA